MWRRERLAFNLNLASASNARLATLLPGVRDAERTRVRDCVQDPLRHHPRGRHQSAVPHRGCAPAAGAAQGPGLTSRTRTAWPVDTRTLLNPDPDSGSSRRPCFAFFQKKPLSLLKL
jgi:hypothetical protein